MEDSLLAGTGRHTGRFRNTGMQKHGRQVGWDLKDSSGAGDLRQMAWGQGKGGAGVCWATAREPGTGIRQVANGNQEQVSARPPTVDWAGLVAALWCLDAEPLLSGAAQSLGHWAVEVADDVRSPEDHVSCGLYGTL